MTSQGVEARSDTTRSGVAEGESPSATRCARPFPPRPDNTVSPKGCAQDPGAIMTTTQPLSDNRAVMLHLALCNIASADPGPESVQSLAHEMALIARQAIGQYLNTAEQAAETQRLREADGFAAGIEGRAREMLADLIGRNVSDTTLRMATDWLKQEARITTRALTPVREAEAISTASEGEVEAAVARIGRQIDKEGGGGMTRPLSDGKRYMVIAFSQYEADLMNRYERGKNATASPKVASDTAPGAIKTMVGHLHNRANFLDRNGYDGTAVQLREAADMIEHLAALSATRSDSVGGVEG
jgi:hypothetical protein